MATVSTQHFFLISPMSGLIPENLRTWVEIEKKHLGGNGGRTFLYHIQKLL